MADATAVEGATGTSGPDRTLPEELIQLALLAARRGAAAVGIHYSGLGHEFGAPIGWIIHVSREDHHYRARTDDDLFYEHQIGCDVADVKAPAWLTASAADGTPDATTIDDYLELFEAGLRNGWEMTYTREVREHDVWMKVLSKDGTVPHEDTLGMRHHIRGTAFNYGWVDGGPDPMSIEISLSRHELEHDDAIYEILGRGSEDSGQRDRAYAEKLLRNQAPGFVPVAYMDDDLEEWVK